MIKRCLPKDYGSGTIIVIALGRVICRDPVGVRPIRVADAQGEDKKKPGKKTTPPPAAKTVHLHFYLDPTGSYSVSSLFDFIRGPEDYNNPLNRWDTAGISLVLHSKVDSGAADFKKSLQDPGAVVVYLGHSALDFKNKRSMGLTPKGISPAEIPPDKLMELLKQSKASLVVLASCASSTLVGKMSGGPAVVVTNSQCNLTTWSNDWANALGPFLLVLLGFDLPPSVNATDSPKRRSRQAQRGNRCRERSI